MTKLSIIAPAYAYYPILAPSMIAQTCPNWELILIHDGPNKNYEGWIDGLRDSRIKLCHSPHRYGLWGHPNRASGIQIATGEYLCVSNADNYYVPSFVRDTLNAVENHDGAHCDMLHSHHDWRHLVAHMEYCKIDCGAFIIRTEVAKKVGWPWYTKDSDWTFISECAKIAPDIVRIEKTLFVHN